MGRTNPTYRDVVHGLEDNWQQYRKALRRVHKPHFDRLFEHAREHADAARYLNHQQPEVTLLVSVVLEQEKRMQSLHERIRALESESAASGEETIRLPPDRRVLLAGTVMNFSSLVAIYATRLPVVTTETTALVQLCSDGSEN